MRPKQTTMRIINVIEIIRGIVSGVTSFVINDETNKSECVTQLDKAEQRFTDLATENGCEDINQALDNRNWDDLNGYEVLIIESASVSL